MNELCDEQQTEVYLKGKSALNISRIVRLKIGRASRPAPATPHMRAEKPVYSYLKTALESLKAGLKGVSSNYLHKVSGNQVPNLVI